MGCECSAQFFCFCPVPEILRCAYLDLDILLLLRCITHLHHHDRPPRHYPTPLDSTPQNPLRISFKVPLSVSHLQPRTIHQSCRTRSLPPFPFYHSYTGSGTGVSSSRSVFISIFTSAGRARIREAALERRGRPRGRENGEKGRPGSLHNSSGIEGRKGEIKGDNM